MTVFEVLLKQIEDQISLKSEPLLAGAAKDFAEYKELCGVIQGLAIAKREINDLAKRQKEHNDD